MAAYTACLSLGGRCGPLLHLAAAPCPARLLAGCQQLQAFQDVAWDLERVQLGFQELRIDFEALLLSFLDVFEHAEGQLAFYFLRAAWVESRIECHNLIIADQGQLYEGL